MAKKIKVVAGDLDDGVWIFQEGLRTTKLRKPSTKAHRYKGETYDLKTDLQTVEQINEDNIKKMSGAAGWGLAGAALLGPLGLIGGLVLGGNKKEVAFVAHFQDGRKFMATTDGKTYNKLAALAF